MQLSLPYETVKHVSIRFILNALLKLNERITKENTAKDLAEWKRTRWSTRKIMNSTGMLKQRIAKDSDLLPLPGDFKEKEVTEEQIKKARDREAEVREKFNIL